MEHALAQPYMDKHEIIPDSSGKLRFPFQKRTELSFVDEVIHSEKKDSIFRKLDPYFFARLGRKVSTDDLESIRNNPKAVRSLVSDKLYYRTALGLEVSELVGLINVERKLIDIKPGQMVVEVSPAETELRKTEVQQNWFRVYEKKDDESVSAFYIKTFDDFRTVLDQYNLLGNKKMKTVYAQDLIANPVVFNGNLEDFLDVIDFNTDPEYIATYEKTMNDARVVRTVNNFVKRVVGKSEPVGSLEAERKSMEKYVIKIHEDIVSWYLFKNKGVVSPDILNQIGMYQQFYGMGGGCGPDIGMIMSGTDPMSALMTSIMGEEYGGMHCPSCGAWIPWGSKESKEQKCSCGLTASKLAAETGQEVCD